MLSEAGSHKYPEQLILPFYFIISEEFLHLPGWQLNFNYTYGGED